MTKPILVMLLMLFVGCSNAPSQDSPGQFEALQEFNALYEGNGFQLYANLTGAEVLNEFGQFERGAILELTRIHGSQIQIVASSMTCAGPKLSFTTHNNRSTWTYGTYRDVDLPTGAFALPEAAREPGSKQIQFPDESNVRTGGVRDEGGMAGFAPVLDYDLNSEFASWNVKWDEDWIPEVIHADEFRWAKSTVLERSSLQLGSKLDCPESSASPEFQSIDALGPEDGPPVQDESWQTVREYLSGNLAPIGYSNWVDSHPNHWMASLGYKWFNDDGSWTFVLDSDSGSLTGSCSSGMVPNLMDCVFVEGSGLQTVDTREQEWASIARYAEFVDEFHENVFVWEFDFAGGEYRSQIGSIEGDVWSYGSAGRTQLDALTGLVLHHDSEDFDRTPWRMLD